MIAISLRWSHYLMKMKHHSGFSFIFFTPTQTLHIYMMHDHGYKCFQNYSWRQKYQYNSSIMIYDVSLRLWINYFQIICNLLVFGHLKKKNKIHYLQCQGWILGLSFKKLLIWVFRIWIAEQSLWSREHFGGESFNLGANYFFLSIAFCSDPN